MVQRMGFILVLHDIIRFPLITSVLYWSSIDNVFELVSPSSYSWK
jgi:hypothetical protein